MRRLQPVLVHKRLRGIDTARERQRVTADERHRPGSDVRVIRARHVHPGWWVCGEALGQRQAGVNRNHGDVLCVELVRQAGAETVERGLGEAVLLAGARYEVAVVRVAGGAAGCVRRQTRC